MPESKTDKLLDEVSTLEESGMNTTKQWYDLWSESMRYVFSDHDVLKKKHADWDYVVMNYIWPTAMQEMAKLAKNWPKILAKPNDDSDAASAEVWQGATQWQWQEGLGMRLNQLAAIFSGKIFGYRVSMLYWEPKCYWDAEQKQWVGDVKYKLWNPAFFWADGDETIDDGNCGTVRWVTLEWAKRQWPGNDKDFEEIAVSAKDSQEAAYGDVKFKSWMSGSAMAQSEGGPETDMHANRLLSLIDGSNQTAENTSDQKMVRIGNCFRKNYDETHRKDTEDIGAEELIGLGVVMQGPDRRLYDPLTQELYEPDKWPQRILREYDEPDFPNGQNILTAGEGERRFLLNPKKEDQVWGYSRWPFVVTPHYLLPFMWQGINAVSLFKSTQDMINVSVSHLFNNLKQFGDPKIALEDGAIALNPKTKKAWSIKAGAGAILRLVRGGLSKYRIEPPTPVSTSAISFFQMMAQDFKDLSGLQDVAKGKQMEGNTTATEVQTVAISANDRIYLQSVYEDEWVKQCSKLIAEIMQAQYDPGRFVKIIGEDNIDGIQQITSGLKSVKYDITVLPGTTLPFDEEKRIARTKMAYELFLQPAANPMLPEMLRTLDIPNWKKLLDEYEVWQDYQALLQLVEAVKAGQLPPEQAMQMIVERLMQIQGQEILTGMQNGEENQQETGEVPVGQGETT
jgi:hypothetical protein